MVPGTITSTNGNKCCKLASKSVYYHLFDETYLWGKGHYGHEKSFFERDRDQFPEESPDVLGKFFGAVDPAATSVLGHKREIEIDCQQSHAQML